MHGNTDKISHVTISACPGITSSFTSSGSPNDITQHFFPQIRFLHGHYRYPFWNVDGYFCGYCLIPIFINSTVTFDVSNGVNDRFVHRVLWMYHAFQILRQFLDPQFDHHVWLNLFWGVYGCFALHLNSRNISMARHNDLKGNKKSGRKLLKRKHAKTCFF